MANAVVGTGNGTTAALSTTTFVSNVISVDMGESSIQDVSTTYLGVTKETYIPGDTIEHGEVRITYQFDAEATQLTEGTVETLTITYPQGASATSPANEAGTGYIKSVKKPTLENNGLQVGEFVFKWNGLTGPTFTAAT